MDDGNHDEDGEDKREETTTSDKHDDDVGIAPKEAKQSWVGILRALLEESQPQEGRGEKQSYTL